MVSSSSDSLHLFHFILCTSRTQALALLVAPFAIVSRSRHRDALRSFLRVPCGLAPGRSDCCNSQWRILSCQTSKGPSQTSLGTPLTPFHASHEDRHSYCWLFNQHSGRYFRFRDYCYSFRETNFNLHPRVYRTFNHSRGWTLVLPVQKDCRFWRRVERQRQWLVRPRNHGEPRRCV